MCTQIYQLLKVFNDATNTLSGIYYLIINLLIIKSFNIVDAFDDCMTQEPGLIPCIQVIKSKWLDYCKNISVIYLFGIIFDPHYKFDYLSDYLKLIINIYH